MKAKRKRRLVLLLLCYLVVALIWMITGAVKLAMDAARDDGEMAPRTLEPGDFTELSGVWVSPEWDGGDRTLMTLDPDPRMILQLPEGLPLGRFVFQAEALNKASGGIHLYYTTAPGQDFSERRKLWAGRDENGAWSFDVGGRRVYALRLDPDSVGGVIWRVEAITLNAKKPGMDYFLPDARGWFFLAFVPPLAAAALSEAAALVNPWFARRRLERKWQQDGTVLKPRQKPKAKP